MSSLCIVAITFAMMAMGLAAFVYIRLENLEKKLKELPLLAKDFSSLQADRSR